MFHFSLPSLPPSPLSLHTPRLSPSIPEPHGKSSTARSIMQKRRVSFHPSTESIGGIERVKKGANSLKGGVVKGTRSKSLHEPNVRKISDMDKYLLYLTRPDLDVQNNLKKLRKQFILTTVLAKKIDHRQSKPVEEPVADLHKNCIEFTWRVFIHDQALSISVCHCISLLHEMPSSGENCSFFGHLASKHCKRKIVMDKELLFESKSDADQFVSEHHGAIYAENKHRQMSCAWELEEKDSNGNNVGMTNSFSLYKSDKSKRLFPVFGVETGVDYILEINGRKFEPVDIQYVDQKRLKHAKGATQEAPKGSNALWMMCGGCLGTSKGTCKNSDIRTYNDFIERQLSSMHSSDSFYASPHDVDRATKPRGGHNTAMLHYRTSVPSPAHDVYDTPHRGHYDSTSVR